MQQDNNHIENKLRQLENQQLPDLSAMEQHWLEMKKALTPVAGTTIAKKISSSYRYALLVAVTAAVAILVYIMKHSESNLTKPVLTAGNENMQAPAQPMVLPYDTPGKNKNVIILKANTPPCPVNTVINVVAPPQRKDTLFLKVDTVLKQLVPVTKLPGLSAVNSFYEQIQKPVQVFTVSADKGGEIKAAEGTKVIIPPTAFVDAAGRIIEGNVVIKLEEFYNYADIIAANLTTASNGEQLVTGGMVKLTAFKNNEEVQLGNGKAVGLQMPAKNFDPGMELFLAANNKSNKNYAGGMDTAASFVETGVFGRRINWMVVNSFRPQTFDGMTNFLKLEDEPVRVRETKTKRIAAFHVTNQLPMTEDEIKEILLNKYGTYYDVIKVKKVKPVVNILFSKATFGRKYIGDSTRLTVDQAVRWHYINREDSMKYVLKVKADSLRFIVTQANAMNAQLQLGMLSRNSATGEIIQLTDSLKAVYTARLQVMQSYSFSVNRMGWINCDRFYKYDNKSDFVVNLPAGTDAGKFVTQLVFTNIRSVMPGEYDGNKIGFRNIPVNMPVCLVGLGEQDGKVMSFIQPFKTSASAVSITKLEETTPEAFKEKLKQLDQ